MAHAWLVVAAIAFLQVADTVTTVRIIVNGGFERNKVLRMAMERIGVLPALVAFKAVYVVILAALTYQFRSEAWLLPMLYVVAVMYLAVVIGNLMVLRR